MRRLLPLLTVALAAACGVPSEVPAAADRPAAPSNAVTMLAAPTRADTGPEPGWEVGARELPRRPDGFGEVGRTPKALRVRELPTVDRLPPPPDGRWASTREPIDDGLRARMGRTWHRSCPVGLGDLRYLTVSFRGFAGAAHTGELIVHRRVARDVVEVFRTLFRADFPIESMRIVTGADLDAAPTGDGILVVGSVAILSNSLLEGLCRMAIRQCW